MTNQKKRQLLALPTWMQLVFLYIIGAIFRYALACAFSNNVAVVLDEALYTNLMRSLWTSGSVTFRNQPVIYDSLLYPLLLSPLYALGQSINIHRAIQLVNSLMMNAAVFPAYALALRITGKHNRALAIAALAICLPDMAMVTLAMTESLGYPLLLLTLMLCDRAFRDRSVRGAVLASVFCVLLYFLKPGYIAVGAVYCLLLAGAWIREKGADVRNQFLAALGVLVAGILILRILCGTVFGVDYSSASYYSRVWTWQSLGTMLSGLNGVLLYVLFFAASAMVFPMIVPLGARKQLGRDNRRMLDMSLLSVLFLILGICFSIYHDEFTGNVFYTRMHLRYLFPFMPILLSYFSSDAMEESKPSMLTVAGLCFFLCGMVVFSFAAIKTNYPVDNMSLFAVLSDTPLTNARLLFQLAFMLLASIGGYWLLRNGFTRGFRNAVIGCFVVFCVANGAATYVGMSHNNDPAWTADARQAAQITADGTVLNVAEDGAFLWNPSTTLDTHVRKPMYATTIDDMLHNTQYGGRYASFVPTDVLAMSPERQAIQADWLVLDQHAFGRILHYSAEDALVTDNLHYYVLPLYEGRAWIHSGLSGLVQREWITPETSGWLHIFDETLCAQETVSVWISLRAGMDTTSVTLRYEDWEETYYIGNTLTWIEASIPVTNHDQSIRIEMTAPANVYVETYRVQ